MPNSLPELLAAFRFERTLHGIFRGFILSLLLLFLLVGYYRLQTDGLYNSVPPRPKITTVLGSHILPVG